MLYLHKGDFKKARSLERRIQSDPDLKTRQLYVLGDFQPSDVKHKGKYFQILPDARVSQLSSYLISGIEEAEEWVTRNFKGFQASLTYFFMNGTGPSPFNTRLGDIYLKVGHYNSAPHDKEIVQHAIIHELTHIYLRNQIGFRIRQEEFGVRKFFDEGFAQYCGFQSVNAYRRKLAHADACSAVIVKNNMSGLNKRIDNWQNTLFKEKHYPLYQASLSFIAYMDEAIGFDSLQELFENANGENSFLDVIKKKTGSSFSDLLCSWINRLPDHNEQNGEDFFGITASKRLSASCIQLSYQSNYPLYPVKDILVLNDAGEQQEVTIARNKRYEKTGDFNIFCECGEALSLAIVFDDHAQRVEIEKCV